MKTFMNVKNMIPSIEIEKIYKLTDSNPPAFAKIIKISKHNVWSDVLEDDEEENLAWGNWYQWRGKDIYCTFNAGFEARRLILATQDEIDVYENKVRQYRLEE